MVNRAQTLQDLKVPPANRLESLKGKRIGQYIAFFIKMRYKRREINN